MSSLPPITQKTVQRRFLEKEEITQLIRQELQSQNFFGQRKKENKICYYCGKNGHILRFCRKRQYDLGGTQQYAYRQYLI